MENVFVTVGTTEFDKLISSFNNILTIKALKRLGCKRITLQIGNSRYEPQNNIDGVQISYYRFKDRILDDIAQADLVIGHAGAGTCLETLELQKPLLVVVNQDLMNNHQFELAKKLSESRYIYHTTCDQLIDTLIMVDFKSLRIYPQRDHRLFAKAIDRIMGFT